MPYRLSTDSTWPVQVIILQSRRLAALLLERPPTDTPPQTLVQIVQGHLSDHLDRPNA